jgi:hypothetical protein
VAEHRSTVTFEVSDVLSAVPSAITLVESVPGAEVVEELDDGRVSAILRLDSGAEPLSHPVVVTVEQTGDAGWRSLWELTGPTQPGWAELAVQTSPRSTVKRCDFSIVLDLDDDGLADPTSRRRIDILLDRVGAQTARNLEALLVAATQPADGAGRESSPVAEVGPGPAERRTEATAASTAKRSALVGAGLLLALVGARAWRRHQAGR